MEVNVVCLHTTEGTSLPSYDGGAVAPNLTAMPDFTAKRLAWYQHFDFDVSSRALVNLSGGVQTNTLNVSQVELVGTCDPTTHAKWTRAGVRHLYAPELPDWAVRDLAAFLRWAHDQHGVPLTSDVTWKAYPASYGSSNGVRMSSAKWQSFTGICGHQHVPENLHGDPGALPVADILAAAKGGAIPQEADMTISNADAKTLFGADGTVPAARPPVANDDYADGNTSWAAGYALQTAVEGVRKAQQQIADVATDVDAIKTKVDTLSVGGVDLDALADKVADKLAARLAE
jgi:hypothetical protein